MQRSYYHRGAGWQTKMPSVLRRSGNQASREELAEGHPQRVQRSLHCQMFVGSATVSDLLFWPSASMYEVRQRRCRFLPEALQLIPARGPSPGRMQRSCIASRVLRRAPGTSSGRLPAQLPRG